MLRKLALGLSIVTVIVSCSSPTATDTTGPASSHENPAVAQASAAPTPTVEAQPKTLEAATAAEQENADRYSSGDYGGQWLLYSKQLRDAVSQADFVTLSERCEDESERPEGLTFKAEGVRMLDEGTAIVRIGLLDIAKQSRTMVYENGQWVQEPTDEVVENFGRPVAEWKC